LSLGLARRLATFRHVAGGVVACAWLLLLSGQSSAAQVAVVLSDESAPYQEAYQAIRSRLDETPHTLIPMKASGLSASMLEGVQLAVAVGVRASESLAALPDRPPVLAVLVPRAWYVNTGRARLGDRGRSVSAIFLDQPLQRQAQLIRLALPEAQRVGVLLSAEQEPLLDDLNDALRTYQLSLVPGILSSEDRLIATMEGVLPQADVLLAQADPKVFNRHTAQSLFLTSYRYRTPVFGYSRSMTRAGALLSLHSSPAQIGRQAAESVIASLQSGRLPPPAHPAYFSISVNEQVARSLGYTLPPEAELQNNMGARP